jgi:hypothetical protein
MFGLQEKNGRSARALTHHINKKNVGGIVEIIKQALVPIRRRRFDDKTGENHLTVPIVGSFQYRDFYVHASKPAT